MNDAQSDRYVTRRERVIRIGRDDRVDAILVTDPVNVGYLTGFGGEDSYLLVAPDRSVLLTDSRFTEQAAEECPTVERFIRRPGQTMVGAVAKVLCQLRSRTAAFESDAMSVATFESLREKIPSVEWRGCIGTVERLRAIKDADEIGRIRHAVVVAERAFAMFRASLRGADDEKSLADAMEGFLRRAGATCSAFPAIIGSGPRSALPHAIPTDRRCEQSDFLLVDWGALANSYNSDLTRILVTHKISAKLAKIYDIVLDAQMRAIEAIRPGATGGEIDRIARRRIEEAGYGRRFGHSLGHGLGMRVHEAPSLRNGADEPLKPGMVVTVEPGIYLRGWGGVRIEDDVLVTKDGCEVLTGVPKQLDEMIVA